MNQIDIEDLKLALAGWYCSMEDDWVGGGSPFIDPDIKYVMDKYSLTEKDVLDVIPPSWRC